MATLCAAAMVPCCSRLTTRYRIAPKLCEASATAMSDRHTESFVRINISFAPSQRSSLAAIGLSGGDNNVATFVLADNSLVHEMRHYSTHCPHILGVIFPRHAGTRSFARDELCNAATVFIHEGPGGRVRALVQVICYTIAVGIDDKHRHRADRGTKSIDDYDRVITHIARLH